MNKSLSLFSLLLLNTAFAFGTTNEKTTEARYSVHNITERAKKAWGNKWVKVGVATAAAVSVYGLCVKFNVIALPSCFCAAKLVTNAVDTTKTEQATQPTNTDVAVKHEPKQPEQSSTDADKSESNTDNSKNPSESEKKSDSPEQQPGEKKDSPSAEPTNTENNSSLVDPNKEKEQQTVVTTTDQDSTDSSDTQKKQRKATNKQKVSKPWWVGSSIGEMGAAAKKKLVQYPSFHAWRNDISYNPEQGEF